MYSILCPILIISLLHLGPIRSDTSLRIEFSFRGGQGANTTHSVLDTEISIFRIF